MSFSFESMQGFFEDEIPEEWVRCAHCGAPMALDIKEDRVLMWCKASCRMVLDERRVLKGEASYGS